MSQAMEHGDALAPMLSDEQRLLQETLRDALPRLGSNPWATLAQFDLLGLPFDPRDGGAGGGGLDLMVVMEELGRALVDTPYLATVVLGGLAVREGAQPELRAEILGAITAGTTKLALAYLEPGRGHEPEPAGTTAASVGGGYALSGRKVTVIGADEVDLLVVSARTQRGVALFLVDATEESVRVEPFATIDGRRAADVELNGTIVPGERRLGSAGGGDELLAGVLAAGAACLAAEAVGAMAGAIDLTVEHLRSREQFRRPLASFQVLRHRVVDMYVALEQCRSSALLACAALDSPDVKQQQRRASAAKALTGRYGRCVGQQTVQLHGGMGMSLEHRACHYFTRLTAIDALLGDAGSHLRRL